jgi:hypothetical protein
MNPSLISLLDYSPKVGQCPGFRLLLPTSGFRRERRFRGLIRRIRVNASPVYASAGGFYIFRIVETITAGTVTLKALASCSVPHYRGKTTEAGSAADKQACGNCGAEWRVDRAALAGMTATVSGDTAYSGYTSIMLSFKREHHGWARTERGRLGGSVKRGFRIVGSC